MYVRAGWVCIVALASACGEKSAPVSNDARTPDATAPPDAIGLSILDAYGAAWNESDAVVRRRLLEYSAIETLTVVDSGQTYTSRAAVDGAIGQFGGQHRLSMSDERRRGRSVRCRRTRRPGFPLGCCSDADDVAWVSAEQIDAYGVNEHAKAVILRGLQSSGTAQLAPAPEL